jgi:hypothetical protein
MTSASFFRTLGEILSGPVAAFILSSRIFFSMFRLFIITELRSLSVSALITGMLLVSSSVKTLLKKLFKTPAISLLFYTSMPLSVLSGPISSAFSFGLYVKGEYFFGFFLSLLYILCTGDPYYVLYTALLIS